MPVPGSIPVEGPPAREEPAPLDGLMALFLLVAPSLCALPLTPVPP